MKMIFAPDSFKGTLSSIEVIEILRRSAGLHFPDAEIIALPIADGGEGTVDAIVTALGGEFCFAEVTGPLPSMVVRAKYGMINLLSNDTTSVTKASVRKVAIKNAAVRKVAVIEMAQASGLPLLTAEQRNPLKTTTFGTGELISVALNEGADEIILGIGGSATNDGGIGAAAALGVKFLTSGKMPLNSFAGGDLGKITGIDLSDVDPRLMKCKITIICDVKNPLTGPTGATRIFGPQKGASPEILEILEDGMCSYAKIIDEMHMKSSGGSISSISGTGAAGGLAVPFLAFFNAGLKPGITTILDLADFDNLLEGASLVITGEGRIDGQSVFGKVPVGVASRCKLKNVPCIAIVGAIGDGAAQVYDYGIDSIMSIYNKNMTLEDALEKNASLLVEAADRMFRMIKTGFMIRVKVNNQGEESM